MKLITTTITSILSLLTITTDAQLVNKPFSGYATDKSNLLRSLGNLGPFVEAVGFGIPTDVPEGCTIDQAHLFMRHGERYPTTSLGKHMHALFNRIKNSTVEPQGPLAFLKDHEYYRSSDDLLEQETFSGPYAGIGDVFTFGNILRARYNDLVDTEKTLPIFTAGQKRVYDSATMFADGFTFSEYDQEYQMVVLPETTEWGLNTLTNSYVCTNYNFSNYDSSKVALDYKAVEAARLNRLSPGLNITEQDVYYLCTFCAFETNVFGSSEFCNALSRETFIGYEYELDLDLYYGFGPGYNMSSVTGSAYANATATLLANNETESNLYFSFAHDIDLIRFATALGIINQDDPLPYDRVEFYKFFSTNGVVPMGGRLIHERMSCYNATNDSTESYVRLFLNDQVAPHPDCSSGPGYSCPLETFLEIVANRTYDFATDCDLNSSVPQHVSFYWDWETADYPDTYDVED